MMAELAERSGLPVATVKYYLREGLLPPGASTSATRATYDDTHLRRLRLVRALTEVAGLRLDAVRDVVAAVDDESTSLHDAVGHAHTRLSPAVSATEPSLERVRALLTRRGWTLHPSGAHDRVLARALDAMSDLGHEVDDQLLDVYAAAATDIAEHEVTEVMRGDRVLVVERVVLGTLLMEPALLAIRRMAQENVSAAGPGADDTEDAQSL